MARSLANLERLKARIAAMPAAIKPAIRSALEQNADELVALQKNLVPTRTGKLAGSIRKRSGDRDLSVQVVAGGSVTMKALARTARYDGEGHEDLGSGFLIPAGDDAAVSYDYANAVEFGTEKMAAKPFFFPAYRALKKRMKARTSRAALKAIKDLAAGRSAPAASNDAAPVEGEAAA